MARGRMIDKVVILSKKIDKISEGAENLYYRIYVNTDDFGLFHADPKILKGLVYTLRNISLSTIEKRLNELIKVELIKIYNSNNEKYLEIVDFEEHQTFRKDYTRKYKHPKPTKESYESVQGCTESSSKLNKDKLNENKIKEEKIYKKEFDIFMKIYDLNVAGEDAFKAFKALRRKGITFQTIKDAVKGYANHLKVETWKKQMYPASFLRNEKWKDFIGVEHKPSL